MNRSLLSLGVACAIAIAARTTGAAQSPSFEVAAIKLNRLAGGGFSTFAVRPGGRFVATNASLKDLIVLSYQLFGFQLEGAPAWADSERYDINAKAEGELASLPPTLSAADTPPVLLMIRSLLADRFKLRIRAETRNTARYALVLARPGRLGPRLTASTLDCVAIRAERSRASRAAGAGLTPPPPPPPSAAPGTQLPCAAGSAPGYHGGSGMALTSLVSSLSRVVGRAIVDETGLIGPFNWSLEYAPDATAFARVDDAPAAAIDKPSLFAALEEQLGLKLEARRGPVQMIIVERVERLSPD